VLGTLLMAAATPAARAQGDPRHGIWEASRGGAPAAARARKPAPRKPAGPAARRTVPAVPRRTAAPSQPRPKPTGVARQQPPAPPRPPAPALALLVVSPAGEGGFSSLGEALRRAAVGARVRVKAGVYQESVTVARRVEILADEGAVLEGDGGAALTLNTSASVRGLVVRGRDGADPAITVRSGTLALVDCEVTGTGPGVSISGPGARGLLRRCRIHDARGSGLLVYGGAAATIEDCDLTANGQAGVAIGTGARVVLRRCRIQRNGTVGILARAGAAGSVDACDLAGNSRGAYDFAAGSSIALAAGQQPPLVAADATAPPQAAGVVGYLGASFWLALPVGSAQPLSLAFSPDGSLLAGGTDADAVRLWDLTAGGAPPVRALPARCRNVYSLAFAPDGSALASGGGTFRFDNARWIRLGEASLWDPRTGALKRSLTNRPASVLAVGFSADSRTVMSVSDDYTVRRWDVLDASAAGEQTRPLAGHGGAITAVAFSPDAQDVAVASDDYAVRLWNAGTGELRRLLTGHEGPVTSIAFSRDGSGLATASADRTVRLWDARTGDWKRTLTGHLGAVTAVAYSPDSRVLASGSRDGAVRLWDAPTGDLKRGLPAVGSPITALALSPDGRTFAVASEDRAIRVWRSRSSGGPGIARAAGPDHDARTATGSPRRADSSSARTIATEFRADSPEMTAGT
jgi:hypothetical protein